MLATRREPALLCERAAETVALAKRYGFPSWMVLAGIWGAGARLAAGETDAMGDLSAIPMIMIGDGQFGPPPPIAAVKADACLAAGLLDEARQSVAEGLRVSHAIGWRVCDSDLYRIDGEALLAAGGNARAAEPLLERALAVAREQQAKWYELRAVTSLARLRLDEDRRADARALLEPVYEWFTEGYDLQDMVVARTLLERA
jgi:hypothetical protein